MNTTICVLLYGDHQPLAARCLNSILALPPEQYQLRIAMNEVSAATHEFVDSIIKSNRVHRVYDSPSNLHKYPAMRRLLYDPQDPIATDLVMWFDDDSYVTSRTPQWLPQIESAMQDADMLGSVYTKVFEGKQVAWLQGQPWYTGRPLPLNKKQQPYASFCTGGWWVTRYRLLQQHNWPLPELDHRGGDVMFGELCYQQRLRLKMFRAGVAINADEHGNESKAKRRGFDSVPVGYHGPGTAAAPPPALVKKRPFLELDL